MADEQPNIPSAEPGQSDAPVADSTSADAEASPSKSPSWWQRLTGRGNGGPSEDQPSTEESTAAAKASSTFTLTEEELERKVQAETDRREARRAADAKAKQKRELRDKDPWAYAEQERQEEQVGQSGQQLEQFVTTIGTEHDRVSIDPVFLALPEAERERISKLDGAGQGLAGRKLVVSESLKALEKHWKAEGAKDAEARLRRNPAFRKQVLTELRGQSPEPELLPAGGGSESDKTISGLLRDYYHLG